MSSKHQRAHATFAIYQDVELPEFWTAYFGVRPDLSAVKGERRITPSGKPSAFPARVGVWAIKSQAAICSDCLEPHLRYLVERLGLPRPDLREIIERTGARMRFFCYWDNETGDRVPDVPDDIRMLMESLGGSVEIDEYR